MENAGRVKLMRSGDLSALPVQNFFDYDIDDLNRRFGKGNWLFAYWKEDRKV